MPPKIETPLHIRKMLKPEPEMVAEEEIAYTQLHQKRGKEIVVLDEWVHWDPESGKMLEGGKPTQSKMRPTGGMIARDTLCKDCGAHRQAGRSGQHPSARASTT